MNHKKRRRSMGIMRAPIFKFLFLVFVLLVIWVVFMNGCKLESIELSNCTKYTEEQIMNAVIGDAKTDNTVLIYLKYRFLDKLSLPFIEQFDFEFAGTNKLHITVYEKMVIGCVEFLGEYMYFDKDGIVVESSSTRLENVPYVKGLTFKKVIMNEKIVAESDEIYQSILNLSQLNEKYDLGIDVMAFNALKEITLECDDVKVMVGKRTKFDDLFGELKGILNEVKDQKITIDMTKFGEGKNHIYAVPNND